MIAQKDTDFSSENTPTPDKTTTLQEQKQNTNSNKNKTLLTTLGVFAVGYLVGFAPIYGYMTLQKQNPVPEAPKISINYSLTDQDKSDISQKTVELLKSSGHIESILLSKGDVMADALIKYQTKDLERKNTLTDEQRKIVESEENSIVLGNRQGTRILTVYHDYNCVYCRRFNENIPSFLKNHPDVKLLIKQMPIITPDSPSLAKISLALQKEFPEKAYQFHERAQRNNTRLDFEKGLDIVRSMGIDTEFIREKTKDPELQKSLDDTISYGKTVLAIEGTPTLYLNGKKNSGYLTPDELEVFYKKTLP